MAKSLAEALGDRSVWEEPMSTKKTPAPQVGGTHYQQLNPEPILVIESWDLPHHLACALKYIARRRTPEDIKKAIWYLRRWLEISE